MCSFLFFLSKRTQIKTGEALSRANRYMARRGPDTTNAVGVGDAILMHNLLHIAGSTPIAQPIADESENIIVLFNGEIFNFRDFTPDAESDSASIIHAYLAHGPTFAKHLDGEFAIVLWDRTLNKLIVTSDTFMTKPLHISVTKTEIGVASYKSALTELEFENPIMFRPNTTQVYDVSDLEDIRLEATHQVHDFDLRQYKTDTDDWANAFMAAVRKRATHGNTANSMFVNLSSGYDSGSIALALNLQQLPYASFSSFKLEDPKVLNSRLVSNRLASCSYAFQVAQITDMDRSYEAYQIKEIAEPFIYVHEDAPGYKTALHDDGGAKAMNYICRYMSSQGYRVVLSGSGADEIMSDYGFRGNRISYHSQFGGVFPEDLSSIFPWRKFYDDSQRSYLFKDEFVAGAHAIEGRYPFLDPQVVQEYLSLSYTVKNKTYKAPIHDFLTKYDYPFAMNSKCGFNI